LKKNYEIKCRLSSDNFKNIKSLLSKNGSYEYSIEKQTDIYYKVKSGRLKLRIINDKTSNLIFYNRADSKVERVSNYLISSSENFKELEIILSKQFDILIRVVKKREIFIKDNVRIHIDAVKDLGKFLEIEVIYDNLAKAKIQMTNLIDNLNLNKKDFIKVSYSDLLINKK
jgi:adenylate cyclase class 2